MAKKIENYEAMLVISLKNGEDAVKVIIEKFKSMIEANGTIEAVDEWGKRKLAYEIQDETEAYYVVYTFTANPAFPAELSRVLKITDGVLRSLVTVK